MIKKASFFILVSIFYFLAPTSFAAPGASLLVSPNAGTFTVGSTFTASIILNTNGNSINTLEAALQFPPDKLQVVSPSLGVSIINVWTNQPQFDNQRGVLNFQGGVPDPGISTNHGLIATVTFRVKSVGQAVLKFTDTSKILLNDGEATDILANKTNAIFNLVLPPPLGPIVVSETHPDQSRWYAGKTVGLRWSTNPAEKYSYSLSAEPVDIPDDIAEGITPSVVYNDVVDGIRFFHVKALRDGVWGETSHFGLKIDSQAPAEFPIEVSPGIRTSQRRPLINFFTTDGLSGMDHYELKVVPLSVADRTAITEDQPFFTEATSPYAPELQIGKYELLVRAYDKTGNFREVAQRISVVTPWLRFFGYGALPWWLLILIGLLLLLIVLYILYRLWRWHEDIHRRHELGAMQDPAIQEKIRQLQEKQSEYLKHLVLLFGFIITASLLFGSSVQAAQTAEVLSAPLVTTVSKNISNEELLYMGGKATVPDSSVIVYLQNLQDGQTVSDSVVVDKKGDWFYSHPTFLPAGRYVVWAQGKYGQELSVPTPQFEINIGRTALQFGVSRISLETLYLGFVFILLIALLISLTAIVYYWYHGRKKQKRLLKEIFEAEEAIKRGFLIMRNDIQAELAAIDRTKARNQFTELEKQQELKLRKDLEWVNKVIEKEVRDIERLVKG